MLTVCEPHGEEKVTLPLCFLTVIEKLAGVLPFAVCEAGDT